MPESFRTHPVILPGDHTWIEVMDVTLDDDPTSWASSGITTKQFGEHELTGVLVGVHIEAVGTPTTVRIVPQFLVDRSEWYDFEEGFWASLMWEDTVPPVNKVFFLPLMGVDIFHFRAIGAGTDADNRFTVRIKIRGFAGPSLAPHA